MKNIHILPIDKPSRLSDCHNNNLHLDDVRYLRNYQNIYITSDEEIKKGDWYLTGKFIWQMKYPQWGEEGQGEAKKIILTTDVDLIKDGVQAIDDEFINWFIKNPSCEEVEVIKGSFDLNSTEIMLLKENYVPESTFDTYKIIIPKELPQLGTKEFNDLASAYFGGKPKQETLEEAAETELYKTINKIIDGGKDLPKGTNVLRGQAIDYAFQIALKITIWQQERSYGEEEVKQILLKSIGQRTLLDDIGIPDWFEQFKKK